MISIDCLSTMNSFLMNDTADRLQTPGSHNDLSIHAASGILSVPIFCIRNGPTLTFVSSGVALVSFTTSRFIETPASLKECQTTWTKTNGFLISLAGGRKLSFLAKLIAIRSRTGETNLSFPSGLTKSEMGYFA